MEKSNQPSVAEEISLGSGHKPGSLPRRDTLKSLNAGFATLPIAAQRRKLAFVTSGSAWGGVEQHIFDLLQSIDNAGFSIWLLTLAAVDLYTQRLPSGQTGVRVILNLSHRSFLAYWRQFRSIRPDVVIFEAGEIGDFPWYAYLAAKLCGGRVVDFSHHVRDPGEAAAGNGLWGRARRLFGWRARHMLDRRLTHRFSDVIVAGGTTVKDNLIQTYGYRDDEILVIPYGIDTARFCPARNAKSALPGGVLRPDEPLLVCVSRLAQHKRIDILLDALKLLDDQGVAFHCVVAGAGNMETQLKTQRDSLGLVERVRFAGFVDDTLPYLQAADLFVLPSDEEGFGLVLIEAMACGVPCVAADSGGPRDIITHGRDGWIVERGSPERFAAAIRDALADRESLLEMGRRARETAVQRFSIRRCVEEIERRLLL